MIMVISLSLSLSLSLFWIYSSKINDVCCCFTTKHHWSTTTTPGYQFYQFFFFFFKFHQKKKERNTTMMIMICDVRRCFSRRFGSPKKKSLIIAKCLDLMNLIFRNHFFFLFEKIFSKISALSLLRFFLSSVN